MTSPEAHAQDHIPGLSEDEEKKAVELIQVSLAQQY